jgi:hypothetical protein
MKLHLASMFPYIYKKYHELLPYEKLNILLSYANIGSNMEFFCLKNRDNIDGTIFDCGAWTANNSKSVVPGSITVEKYIDYLVTLKELYDKPLVDEYFSFDIDFSNKGFGINHQNYLRMIDAGLHPTYVIHDIYGDEIEYFIDQGCKRLALGSAQIKTSETLDYVMNKLISADVSVHLFGHTKFDLIANFPINSCDSAGWTQAGAFGSIKYWNPKKNDINKTDQIYLEEYSDTGIKHKITLSNYEYRDDLENFLHDKFKMSSWDLLKENGGSYMKMLVNIYYYTQLEKIVNQIHKEKGFNTFSDKKDE